MEKSNFEEPEPEITTPKVGHKRKTTTDHMREKKNMAKFYGLK